MDKWYNVVKNRAEDMLRDKMETSGYEPEYFDLDYPKSCLDGDFTAEELRMIADAMDELQSKVEKNANPL